MPQTEPKTSSPLFYSKAEPLNKSRHADLGLVRHPHPYAFAARTNAVPVNTAEFNLVQKFYPIVFTPNAPHQAIAVLGISNDQNLFVDDDGAWSTGHYVPAYIRRFPFIFAQSPEEKNQFVLCVEVESELVSAKPDMPFFENGELTDTAKRALEFCKTFHEQALATTPFLEALQELDLLKEQSLTVRGQDGTERKLGTFHAVDEEKLNAFDDEQFLELRRRKVLPLIYLHLASLSNWSRLLNLGARQAAQTDKDETRH